MAITKSNIKAIQEVLLTDMQRRIFKQYNERKDEFNLRDEDYDNTQSALVDSILNLNDMRDVNELMLEYCDLFDSYDDLTVATVDGTLNYVVGLLVKQCELHKQSV
tara:strand:- start:151 stop:468 length:318 start_codon:yes stop_codon:yes gene_type:complete